MATRRDTLGILGAALGAIGTPLAWGRADPQDEPLKAIAARKGMRFGNAMGMQGDEKRRQRFYDPAYRALMARECGLLVAENEMKWQAVQPEAGPHRFAAVDDMFGWARREGMLLRGHTLLWQSPRWLPKWVNALDFSKQPAGAAESLLRQHIQAVCGHFGRDIISYDVINEAVNPQDGKLIGNVFAARMGALEQIDLAFHLAREAAPGAQLVYNDYMAPRAGDALHRAGVLELLASLKARGTPVDALGLQSHIASSDAMAGAAGRQAERAWRAFLDEVSGMGYALLITEFDVNDRELPAGFAERDAGAAALARDYLDLTLSYPKCRDLLLWGMADHVSWLQEWKGVERADGLPQRPTPFDSNLRAKPMRGAIAAAMRAMPGRAAL
ncbi:MAG: endo-1,4-beta-xylanase [Pseudomonadota bacterium]